MSDNNDVNDAPKGETEEEYYERIKSAPGIFSDFNETAKDVVERAEKELKRAEHLFKHSTLAPNPHPEAEAEEPQVDAEPVEDETPTEEPKAETKAEETEPEKVEETPKTPTEDASGPAGEYATQLPAEDQAGQPPRPEDK